MALTLLVLSMMEIASWITRTIGISWEADIVRIRLSRAGQRARASSSLLGGDRQLAHTCLIALPAARCLLMLAASSWRGMSAATWEMSCRASASSRSVQCANSNSAASGGSAESGRGRYNPQRNARRSAEEPRRSRIAGGNAGDPGRPRRLGSDRPSRA